MHILFSMHCYPVIAPREEGLLKVSEGHALFYALYGNPEGIPVVVLHGGPGAGCSDQMTQFFDLKLWNVVMFDQRGAMRSAPFCCMEHNTTQHAISDIEMLRKHLGIEKWVVFGGSWGATLALLYGQEHPEACLGFILRGIFFGRRQDYLHLFYGMGRSFPESYELFCNYIPQEERSDLFAAYYRRIFDPNPAIVMEAAKVFLLYDMTCSTHFPNPKSVETVMHNERLMLSMTKAFFHYCKNDFFIENDQVLSNMHKMQHLSGMIVQGRWDAVNPPDMAYALHKHWPNSKLSIVSEGGHSTNDLPIASAVAQAVGTLGQKLR